jgi:DNA-3-methyladenine glycosylase II
MATRTFSLRPQGAFSLRESALFGFGQRMRPAGVGQRAPGFDGIMRLAFCVDGDYEQQAGVEVRQDASGVHGVVHGEGSLGRVRDQVARVLSLDYDATRYDAVGDRDPVIARLQAAAPGLRPPLFYSPYEAAVWAVLAARRPGWQMDRVRTGLSRAHGRVFRLAGTELAALPTPSALLRLDSADGIDPARLGRIRGVAQAARDGLLDAATLRAMDPPQAMAAVQQINGIGPFYAALIVIRATGVRDVLPANEPEALALAGQLYGDGTPLSVAEFTRIAAAWPPWRTWCTVLLRAAAPRLPPSRPEPGTSAPDGRCRCGWASGRPAAYRLPSRRTSTVSGASRSATKAAKRNSPPMR